MNQSKSKLFRDLFHDRQSYRKFKKAYAAANVGKRLEIIAVARRIKATGPVKWIQPTDGEQAKLDMMPEAE